MASDKFTSGMDKDHNAFEDLLRQWNPDSSLEENYKNIRLKLSKFFIWRRCEDPEELADETIERAVRNINGGEKIDTNIYSYLRGIAMNIFREYVRTQIKHREVIAEMLESSPLVLPDSGDCQTQCLESLTAEKLALIESYYDPEEDREKIALSQRTTINALRLQIHRIKIELRDCYKNCLKSTKSRKLI